MPRRPWWSIVFPGTLQLPQSGEGSNADSNSFSVSVVWEDNLIWGLWWSIICVACLHEDEMEYLDEEGFFPLIHRLPTMLCREFSKFWNNNNNKNIRKMLKCLRKHFRKCWEIESGEVRERKKLKEEENGSRRKMRTGRIMSKRLYSEASPWAVLPPKCNSKRKAVKICVQISVGSFRISWSKWASNTWKATRSRERSAVLWSENVDCCLSSAERVTLGTSSPVWCQLHIFASQPKYKLHSLWPL